MTSTTILPGFDERGLSAISLRLMEPIESIVANNPNWKVERTAEGVTVFMSPTGGESGARNSEINFQLVAWTRTAGGIAFDSSTMFRLPNGALRSPDASWITDDRWQSLTELERENFPPIAPDFVIELRSKSDRLVDLQEKMDEYISNGVRLGWLIDPLSKQIHIYRPKGKSVILDDPRSVTDDVVLPGFCLDVARLF